MTRGGTRETERSGAPWVFNVVRDMSPGEFERFRSLIRDTAGIALSDGKKDLLRARLGKVLRTRGIPSFGEYLRLIEEDATGREVVLLLDAVSTNLTFFFREPDHLLFLARQALPEIAAARPAPGSRRIRGWSAGCSTGEEPYSIAITLLEQMRAGEGWDIRLLATDLSTRAVAAAKTGRYAREKLRNMPPQLIDRYFAREEDGDGREVYGIGRAARRLVTFARLNLLAEYPFKGPFDFIFCRNVMIYFARETQKMLIERICGYLAEGGYLFVGHSESLHGIPHPLRYIRPSVYRKPGTLR